VQLPLATNVTASPELAVAPTPKSGSPNVFAISAPNVIVWFPLAIVNVCGTSGAALKFASPACFAVIVQLPAPVMCTLDPALVQLPVAANVTVKPEVAVALTLKSGSPNDFAARAPNVIVWLAFAIVTSCVAVDALKFVVAAPLACTLHVPAPLELNVAPLASAHGPLRALYVSVALSVFVVVALTVKLPPRYVGVGAAPNVIVGVAFAIATSCVLEAAWKFAVSTPLAFTVHVPAPVELNVAPLTNAHGPATTL